MTRRLLYWFFTLLLVTWLVSGGIFDSIHAPAAIAILRKLGYPEYLSGILGACKLLAVPALLHPRSRLLREWAYAGVTFDTLGAFLSHVIVKDAAGATVAPVIMLAFAAASYLLRPVEYRLQGAETRFGNRAIADTSPHFE